MLARDVLFVRTPITKAQDITLILQNLARAGWEVVSHTESQDEYSFVMRGPFGSLYVPGEGERSQEGV